jgi:hypothetical protein
MPAEVMMSPSSTNRSRGLTSMVGSSSASLSSDAQVGPGRPDRSPAAAYTNAPVQTLVVRGTTARWLRTQSS